MFMLKLAMGMLEEQEKEKEKEEEQKLQREIKRLELLGYQVSRLPNGRIRW